MHILHLYVRYDYVQRCEDTISVELRYIKIRFIIIIVARPLDRACWRQLAAQ